VALAEEFLSTEHDMLLDILSSSELNVGCEEIVFEALMRWVQFDTSKRSKHLAQLLPAVRCSLLPTQFIHEQILCNRLLTENCQHYLENIKSFIANPEEFQCKGSLSSASFMPRSGMIQPEHCILFIGGMGYNCPSVNCYSPVTRETYDIVNADVYFTHWNIICKPKFAVTDNNQIFMGGGNYRFSQHMIDRYTASYDDFVEEHDEDVGNPSNFLLYDSDNMKWIPRAPIPYSESFALAHVAGKIYLFGEVSVVGIVECYDIAADHWKRIGFMPTALSELNAVTYRDFVYVLGGNTEMTHYSLLRFDPKCLNWTTLSAVPAARARCIKGACVVSGEIYIIDELVYADTVVGSQPRNSVDVYSIEDDLWRSGPPLPADIKHVGATVVDGSLYVHGVVQRQHVLYRLQQSTWILVEANLSGIRDFTCASALVHIHRLHLISCPSVDSDDLDD